MKIYNLIWNYITCFFANWSYGKKVARMRHEDEVLVILAPKLGDFTYGIMYAKQLKLESGKKLAVYCPEKYVKYIKTYGCVDRIITYPNTEKYFIKYFLLMEMKHFWVRSKYKFSNVVYTLPQEKFYKGLTIKEIYRDYIFCVKHDSVQFLDLSKNDIVVKSIENFERDKSKIVVINPYSNSHARNASKLFQPIADYLNEKGYIVYTNVVGSQKPLKGTKVLDCSVDEFYEICNHIKGFISIRSGLVDFSLNTNCFKFVVYLKEKEFRFKHSLKYFKNNVEEYFVRNTKDNEKILKIVMDKFD